MILILLLEIYAEKVTNLSEIKFLSKKCHKNSLITTESVAKAM